MDKYWQVQKRHPNGTPKTEAEKQQEMTTLMRVYRNQNLLLHDKLFDLEHNVIPAKQGVIDLLQTEKYSLQDEVKKLEEKLKNNKPYLF